MPLMHWSPNLSVGIQFMDDEHRQLMDAVNELHERLSSNTSEGLPETLNAVLEQTREHFGHEEERMRETNYRHLDQHKRLHDALLDELQEFYDRAVSDDMHMGSELSGFLKDWLLEHILESDKHLGGYLEGVGQES